MINKLNGPERIARYYRNETPRYRSIGTTHAGTKPAPVKKNSTNRQTGFLQVRDHACARERVRITGDRALFHEPEEAKTLIL